MRGYNVAVWALVLLAVSGPAPSDAIWAELLPALTAQLTTLWQNSQLSFMGNTCFYSQRPKFYRWELYFEGTFRCPTWSTISGQAKTRSRSKVMTNTIENFFNKARAAGLVSEEEAQAWLNGYSV